MSRKGRRSPDGRGRVALALVCTTTMAIGAMMIAPQSVEAGPIFSFDHYADTFGAGGLVPGGEVGPQDSPIVYDFGLEDVGVLVGFRNPGRNFSEVHGRVDPGSIEIFDRALHMSHNFGTFRQEVIGTFLFDVFFASPNSDPIDIILNLDVAGVAAQGSGNDNNQGVTILAGATSGGAMAQQNSEYGVVNGAVDRTDGIFSNFTADGTTQSVSTGFLQNIPVNQIVQFVLQLGTRNASNTSDPKLDFNVSLAITGNVFDIFDTAGNPLTNVTVNSADANIDNNRFSSETTNAVPEPSSLVLLATGMLAMIGYRRRKRISRQAAC